MFCHVTSTGHQLNQSQQSSTDANFVRAQRRKFPGNTTRKSLENNQQRTSLNLPSSKIAARVNWGRERTPINSSHLFLTSLINQFRPALSQLKLELGKYRNQFPKFSNVGLPVENSSIIKPSQSSKKYDYMSMDISRLQLHQKERYKRMQASYNLSTITNCKTKPNSTPHKN